MTARLFTLDPLEDFRPKTFAGHRDAVVGAYFSTNGKYVGRSLYLSDSYVTPADLHRQPRRRCIYLAGQSLRRCR